MKVVKDKISIEELRQMAKAGFGDLVKAVVDVEMGCMVVDAELHADEEAFMIKDGSKQENLWGINIYPDLELDQRIEFDSMINLKPAQGNRTRSVEDQAVREKIINIINGLIEK